MNRRALLGTLAALGASGVSLQDPAHAADTTVYRIGASPISSSAVVFFAQSQGFFARQGFDVTIEPAGNGDKTAAAIVGGSLDLGGMNTLSLAVAHQNGIPLKIIAPGAEYDERAPATQMLVPRDSSTANARDLNGKVVAVNELGGIAHISAQAWIDNNGGVSKSVRFLEMPFNSMPAALTAHRVDAAVVAEPALTAAKKDSRVLANSYDGIAPRWLINVYVASDPWTAAHPDVVRRMGQAIMTTANWANHHQTETIALESRISNVSPDIIASSTRTIFAETIDLRLIQPVIDVAVRYGALKSRFPASDLLATVPK